MVQMIDGISRDQFNYVTLDMMVSEKSVCRIIDAFVDKFDKELGLEESCYRVGRPSYCKHDLLKLYVWGYLNKICSSRKLMRECAVNLEAMWLMGGLVPDFRTISDFRKDNTELMSKTFAKFIDFCKTSFPNTIGSGYCSVDGTKMRASNAKDKCFTANKIDDRLDLIHQKEEQFKQYLDDIKRNDQTETDDTEVGNIKGFTQQELEEKLKAYERRGEKYKKYEKEMSETGDQISETDPHARLMKHHNGNCLPSFNIQTVVDSETHIITNIEATNACTDHNLLYPSLSPIKEEGKILESVADNGYMSNDDLAKCLENGIIPNVCGSTFRDADGNKTQHNEYDISFSYEPQEISEEEKASTKSEDIQKCLRAGVIPNCYKDCLVINTEDGKPKLVKQYCNQHIEDEQDIEIDNLDEEGKIALAKQGYFVRDIEKDKVYCPQGCILRKKSTKKNGDIRYCNKLGCRQCSHRCFMTESRTTKWKEIDFKPGVRIKPASTSEVKKKDKFKRVQETTKVVFRFKPDIKKLDTRKCLSEHPFGTMKFWRGKSAFLLRGLRKIKAEFALMALGYNITRAQSLYSFENLMAKLS